jgi:alpha-glucosidase
MNVITQLLPGTSVTYYGEEIGMEDLVLSWTQTVDPAGRNAGVEKFEQYSRDPERTPMQWNAEKNAGLNHDPC